MSESIDLQALDPSAIRLPVTVVAVAEDRLVPPSDAYDLVERLRGETRLRVLRSLYGHDAFLKEEDAHRRDPARSAADETATDPGPHERRSRRGRRHSRSAAHSDRCTAAVRAGIDRDTAFGAVTPPIVLSSNFSFAGFDKKRQYDYTRSGNPTRDLLGEALAELEGGAGGVVTATGMGAITLLLHALLKPGDRLVVPHDGYGGSWRLFNALAKKGAFELVTADLHRSAFALTDALATDRRQLVWIETPSNPLLRITDLRFVIEAAQAKGAVTVVDNTFLSPALQQPIAFGADFVVHSTTKYINGHSDVVGGAVVARDAEHAPATGVVGQRAGPDRFAVRQLPHVARPAHAGCAPARPPGEHRRRW